MERGTPGAVSGFDDGLDPRHRVGEQVGWVLILAVMPSLTLSPAPICDSCRRGPPPGPHRALLSHPGRLARQCGQMDENLASQFEANRPRLQSVAYRMLGSLTEAEDAVQETWIRLSRSDPESIDNLGGWLTTVLSRVCLGMLRARRAHSEEPLSERDQPEPEPIGPEEEAVLADTLGPALLLVLETLSPSERLAFVLHDLFAVPFEDIAPIVDRSPAAARQLASRARRRVQGIDEAHSGDRRRQQEVVEAFLAASRRGDFEALVTLLDPDAVLRADRAAVEAAAANRDRGAPSWRRRCAAVGPWRRPWQAGEGGQAGADRWRAGGGVGSRRAAPRCIRLPRRWRHHRRDRDRHRPRRGSCASCPGALTGVKGTGRLRDQHGSPYWCAQARRTAPRCRTHVQQRVDRDVIAGRRPVQRRLLMGAVEPGVDVRRWSTNRRALGSARPHGINTTGCSRGEGPRTRADLFRQSTELLNRPLMLDSSTCGGDASCCGTHDGFACRQPCRSGRPRCSAD